MKYLKTINESKLDPPIDKNYFDMVFADFIDNAATSELTGSGYYLSNIKYNRTDIYDLTETLQELKSCLDKIKDDYPDIKHVFNNLFLNLYYSKNYRYGEE